MTIPKPTPIKWSKRGPQPEVRPKPVSPLVSINNLAKRIREEFDPAEKERLEAQFKAECEAFDAINPGTREVNIVEVYREASSVMGAGLTIPESVGKDEWQDFHSRLIKCKRSMASWVKDSRRYAADKWGNEFVAAAEEQMELSLGIDAPTGSKPVQSQQPRVISAIMSLARIAPSIDDAISTMTDDQLDQIREQIKPIEALIRKLNAQVIDI